MNGGWGLEEWSVRICVRREVKTRKELSVRLDKE